MSKIKSIKLSVRLPDKDKKEEYEHLFEKEVINIGRYKSNDISLPLHTVSGEHVKLIKEEEGYFL
jgi:pSer/pThr/pTyr-binding forkhead associated (FHA) protein